MAIQVELQEDLAKLLRAEHEPIEDVAREMIVLELYRRRTISSGRAAELLGVRREDFIVRSSELGIPIVDMSDEDWAEELRTLAATR